MPNSGTIEHPRWLTTGDFTEADEPFGLFEAWFGDAVASEPRDPTAMTLATVDENGRPDARIVLLKGRDDRGFVFYTNTASLKGRQLDAQPVAALVSGRVWQGLPAADWNLGVIALDAGRPEEAALSPETPSTSIARSPKSRCQRDQ